MHARTTARVVDVLAFGIDQRMEDWRLSRRGREVVVVVEVVERGSRRVVGDDGRGRALVVVVRLSKWSGLP